MTSYIDTMEVHKLLDEIAQLECELDRLEDRIDRASMYGSGSDYTQLLVEQEALCLKIKALQAKL